MLNWAPTGSRRTARPSGWVNKEIFTNLIKYFIQVSKCLKDNSVLQITDNPSSHISLARSNLKIENDVAIERAHPHISHKLQPWMKLCLAYSSDIITELWTTG